MDYGQLIEDFIIQFMEYGVWTLPLAIHCRDKVYAPCKEGERESKFRGFEDVHITEDNSGEGYGRAEDELYVVLNSELCGLFGYGVLETQFNRMSEEMQEWYIELHPEIMDEFYEYCNEEYLREKLAKAGDLPQAWEFDSADEFEAFDSDYIDEKLREYTRIERAKYLAALDRTVVLDNDLEAIICEIVCDFGLSYDYCAGILHIGKNYF